MELLKRLKKSRSEVIDKWFEVVMTTYPAESVKYLSKKNDKFANPIGATTIGTLENVFDELISEFNPEKVKPLLDPIIRIRAVQEFTPSKALSFIIDLKKVIRVVLKKDFKKEPSLFRDLPGLELRIDELCLVGFDIYMGCREQVYKYKANHVKDRTLRLLKKANILCEVPEVGTEIIPHDVYKNGGFDDT